MALNALSVLTQHRLIDDIEKHKDDAHLVVLPPHAHWRSSPPSLGAELLIGRGYADAGEFLDSGGADRAPIRMRMHRHHPTSPNRPARQVIG